ncbi:MAG: protein-glutamate O-methyltransferase CheR [Micavibrio sp.]|nr:protein-glutamate O-methyltransferase CheR [Micavibrio sp.]
MNLHPQDFRFFADLLKRESGLSLTADKTYLLESRLQPVVNRHALDGIAGLAHRLRGGGTALLLRDVVEAMATCETSFFRDMTPFDTLRDKVIPALAAARGREKYLRIWSAACASGQEPYSIAMLLKNHPLLQGWRFEIEASDISEDILNVARAGSYSQFEIQRGLPAALLVRHFTKDGERYVVKPDIKAHVRFLRRNLLAGTYGLGVFDFIFCRNVMIYFDAADKRRVLQSLQGALRRDGALFLGGAETVMGLSDHFRPMPGGAGAYILAEA